jgi:glycosyltransferase involved in cell wall biosynthesis
MKLSDCTFCLPSFSGGGAERVFANLISEFVHRDQYASHNSHTEKMNNGEKETFAVDSDEASGLLDCGKSSSVTCIVMSEQGAMRKLIPNTCNLISIGVNSAKSSLLRLAMVFHCQKPKIVISTMAYFNFIVILALILSLHRPKRILLREANIPSSTIEALPMRWLGRFLYKWLYNRADIVVCNSSETMDELVGLGVDRSRVALIPNPVDIDGVRKQAQEAVNLPDFLDPSLPLFVSLGRLTKQKGMDRLISWVASMGSKANLLIIGQGAERDELVCLIESNGLTGRVKIIDFQNNPFPYMSNSDAVLLGSRWEGLPNVALEALALGKQVVATTHCGGLLDIKHLLDDQALVIADTDEAYISILDRIVDRHHSTRNIKKTTRRDNQLADSKLPDNYNLDSIMEKYEAAIFGR